jgi:hypothetical protein
VIYFQDEEWLDQKIQEQLTDLGLDPQDKSFILDPKYRALKSLTFHSYCGLISVDYYIEKKWFTQDEIDTIKKPFDIGVRKRPGRLSNLALCEELQSDEAAAGIEHNLDSDIIMHIRQKIEGNSGLIPKLKNNLNFDLDKFGNDQQFSKLKLLKLLYKYEKFGKDRINVIGILTRPSLEYVDKSFVGRHSRHGILIQEIVYEIRKEVGDIFAQKVEESAIIIINDWNRILIEVTRIISLPISKDEKLTELVRIKQQIQNLIERFSSIEKYQDNVMEAFYLKINQLKQAARLVDIDKVTRCISKSQITKELMVKENQCYSYKEVIVEDLELYMKDHELELAKLVYQKEFPSSSDKLFIQTHITSVKILHDIYNKQRSYKQLLTLTFIISCLQEIKLTFSSVQGDDEFEYNYEYYNSRYSKRTLRSVFKQISNSKSVEEIYELIWVTKIERRIHANLGTLEEYVTVLEIGLSVNALIRHMVTFPHLSIVKELHSFFRSCIFLSETRTISHYAKEYGREVEKETGFRCKVNSYRVFQYFDDAFIRKQFIADTRITLLSIMENNDSISGNYINEIIIRENKYIVVFNINLEEKVITLSRFFPVLSDKQSEAYIEAGLDDFINQIDWM